MPTNVKHQLLECIVSSSTCLRRKHGIGANEALPEVGKLIKSKFLS